MRILLLASGGNSLCQRVHRELHALGHTVETEIAESAEIMEQAVAQFCPDLVICPFLQKRIPDSVWRNVTCLVVHPGIVGDRGSSSLDWSIMQTQPVWGVTLLQAVEKMDAGDIWGTYEFEMRGATKASIYRREVTRGAIKLIKEAVANVNNPDFKPTQLDYNAPEVKGRWQPAMKQADRKIDWQNDDTATVLRKLWAADSTPGVLDEVAGEAVYLFGAFEARDQSGAPGELIGQSNGAICRATTDGAVWIQQLRCADDSYGTPVKQPATVVLNDILTKRDHQLSALPVIHEGVEDIRTRVENAVAYVEFHFVNGAMNTMQCKRLRDELRVLKQRDDVKAIVLMGGEDFWSNGIHLQNIEVSKDPAVESWANIQAMNEAVAEIIHTPNQLTVAALRSNAGAGGAIMALACDDVIIRDGVVLNPHYRTMGLYGSEYWTYLLPRRVGAAQAQQIMDECLPMAAAEAVSNGMADAMLDEDWDAYHRELAHYCASLTEPMVFNDLLAAKRRRREQDEAAKALEQYGAEELHHMRATFFNPESDYHRLRKAFVYKEPSLPHWTLRRRVDDTETAAETG